MSILDKLDQPSIVVPVSIAIGALLARKNVEAGIAVGAAAPLAVGLCDILKRAVPERRPRLFDKHPEQSFPSSHAAAIGALALAAVANAGAWWAAPFALGAKLSVDSARVARREHWPHDVFWGDLIGIGAAVAAAGLARVVRVLRQRRARAADVAVGAPRARARA